MSCRSSIIKDMLFRLVLGLMAVVGFGELLLSSVPCLSLLIAVGGMLVG